MAYVFFWLPIRPSVDMEPAIEKAPSVDTAPAVEEAPSAEMAPTVEQGPSVPSVPVEQALSPAPKPTRDWFDVGDCVYLQDESGLAIPGVPCRVKALKGDMVEVQLHGIGHATTVPIQQLVLNDNGIGYRALRGVSSTPPEKASSRPEEIKTAQKSSTPSSSSSPDSSTPGSSTSNAPSTALSEGSLPKYIVPCSNDASVWLRHQSEGWKRTFTVKQFGSIAGARKAAIDFANFQDTMMQKCS